MVIVTTELNGRPRSVHLLNLKTITVARLHSWIGRKLQRGFVGSEQENEFTRQPFRHHQRHHRRHSLDLMSTRSSCHEAVA